MMLRTFSLVVTMSLVSACGSVPKMTHPEMGTVSTTDERYIAQRDECVAEYLRAESMTEEAKEHTKKTQYASVVSKELAAVMEVANALESYPEVKSYTETCLKERGWKKLS